VSGLGDTDLKKNSAVPSDAGMDGHAEIEAMHAITDSYNKAPYTSTHAQETNPRVALGVVRRGTPLDIKTERGGRVDDADHAQSLNSVSVTTS